MPNNFLTPAEMAKCVMEAARKASNGDEKLMLKVLNGIAGAFMNMDMDGKPLRANIDE